MVLYYLFLEFVVRLLLNKFIQVFAPARTGVTLECHLVKDLQCYANEVFCSVFEAPIACRIPKNSNGIHTCVGDWSGRWPYNSAPTLDVDVANSDELYS